MGADAGEEGGEPRERSADDGYLPHEPGAVEAQAVRSLHEAPVDPATPEERHRVLAH
jgi:hypothetical protein